MIFVGEQRIDWHPGMTLAELLDVVDERHVVAVVRLNGKLVSRPKFASTPVQDGSEVVLIPMVAGG